MNPIEVVRDDVVVPHRPSPLAVDLDGTLATSDSLLDAIVAVVLKRPQELPAIVAELAKGRLAFKSALLKSGAYCPNPFPCGKTFSRICAIRSRAGVSCTS